MLQLFVYSIVPVNIYISKYTVFAVKRNKKKKKMELDHSSLAFSFHSAMLTGLMFTQGLIQEYGMILLWDM